MMELNHVPQDCTTNGRRAETKLFKLQQIDAINVKNIHPCAKLMNPKGEKLGTCGLEDIMISSGTPKSGLRV